MRLDEDLQQAAVAENEAYVANAKIDYTATMSLNISFGNSPSDALDAHWMAEMTTVRR